MENKELFHHVTTWFSKNMEVAETELDYDPPFHLLIAVILSAQCTDRRVNMVTEKLFLEYKTPQDFAKISLQDLEEKIKSCNYYHNKAKNIIATAKILVEKYNGQVPSDHKDLVMLPGVGNKTANVVEAVGFGKQAFPVDTHILRVSNRWGFVNTDKPDMCEKELKKIFKNFDYAKMHHLMLLFGRYYCTAKTPKCEGCVMRDMCKFLK